MRITNYITRLAFAAASGLLVLSLAGPAQAQDSSDLTSSPGYLNLDEIESWFNSPPNIEVNLRGTLLNLIAGSSNESESEFSSLMSQLKAIQVRGYPLTGSNLDEITQRIDDFSNQLKQNGWERVVYISDDKERVHIYVRSDEDRVQGLTVLATDPNDDETIFINIVGSISPDQIGKIGRGLDIKELEEMPKQQEKQKNQGN